MKNRIACKSLMCMAVMAQMLCLTAGGRPRVTQEVLFPVDNGGCRTRQMLVTAIMEGDIETFDGIMESNGLDIDDPIVTGFDITYTSTALRTIDLECVEMNQPFVPVGNDAGWGNRANSAKPETEVKGIGWICIERSIAETLRNLPPEHGDIFLPNRSGISMFYGTPLMAACRAGNTFMIAELLKRGANPNVMFKVGSIDFTKGFAIRDCERPYVCALLMAADVGTIVGEAPFGASPFAERPRQRKTRKVADRCVQLLVNAGAVLPPEDGKGRNALWDALNFRNEALLNLALRSGADINSRDHREKTVLDYCVRAAGDKSRSRSDRVACERFAAFVRKAGGVCAAESEEDNEDSKDEAEANAKSRVPHAPAQQGAAAAYGQGMQPQYGNLTVSGVGGTFSGIRQKKDNSAEIKMLELRLVDLRRQLEDAEHDARMSGLQGIGTITTGMRVQNIMSQIQEVQGRLLRLQN